MKKIGRGPRQLTVPGTSLRLDYDGRTLQIEGGTAANRARLEEVEPEWVAWPPRPGLHDLALLALVGSGAGAPAHLYRVGAGPDLKPLLDRRTPQGIWVDDRGALVNDDLGRIYRYDAESDTLARLVLDHRPAWARALAEPARVFTLKVDRWPRSARQFEAQEALLRKCARALPEEARVGAQAFGRRLEGSNRCVGVFASLAGAAAAAPAFEAAGLRLEPGVIEAREMSGEFRYGKTVAAGTGALAWCRRAGAGPVELWIERPGEPARRILTGELRP